MLKEKKIIELGRERVNIKINTLNTKFISVFVYIYIYNISDTSINVAYSGLFFFFLVAFIKDATIGIL